MRRVLALLAVAALVAVPAAALAHGELADARPAPGAIVGGEVAEVELRFEEELVGEGLAVVVEGPDGSELVAGNPKIVAEVIARVELEPISAAGTYRVDYTATSVDGFVFEGAYLFTYNPGAPAVEPFPEGRSSAGVTVLLALAGTTLFAGGGWLLARRQAKRVANA